MADPVRPATYERAFVEWIIERTYKQGFEDGVAYADELIDTQLWRCIDPGPDMAPMYLANPPTDATRSLTRALIASIRPYAKLATKTWPIS